MIFRSNGRGIAAALLCTVLTALCCFPAFAEQEAAEKTGGYSLTSESGGLELYLNEATSDFYVKNLADGSVWYSTVSDAQNDTVAAGIYRTELSSILTAVYYDGEGVEDSLNSYSSSVLNDTFSCERIKNGFRTVYNMEDGILEIPVEVTLSGAGLRVMVKTSEMKVKSGYTIDSISVLPYFLSAVTGDEGYMLIPDGCGGLIDFDSEKAGIPAYEKRVYGANITNDETRLEDIDDAAAITLPAFGIRKNGSAVLCMLDDGASLAGITANGAGNLTSRTNAYAKYLIYDHMEYSLSANETVIFEQSGGKLCDLSETYVFLSGENADYSGMARSLKSEYILRGLLTERSCEPSACLTVWGAITARRSFFGILTDRVIPLTTTAQVKEIAAYAEKLGIEKPVIDYVGWNKQELNGKAPTALSVSGALVRGGVSFRELQSDSGFSFVPSLSSVLSYTSGSSIFSRFTTPASNVARVAFAKKKTSPTTVLEYGKSRYFLNSAHIEKNLGKLVSAADKSDLPVLGLSDIGNILYEDFGKTFMKRYDMEKKTVAALGDLSEKTRLMLKNPNAYAYPFAWRVTDIPVHTGGSILLDCEVPFLQMVLSGCVGYSSGSLNNTDIKTAALKMLETGSMPAVYMYYEAEATIKNTDYSFLCGGNYRKALERLSEIYASVKEVNEKASGSAIVSHSRLSDSTAVTRYENGLSVYVNYSSADFELSDGGVIPAEGYLTEVTGA